MKWDIDKALTALEAEGTPGTSIERIAFDPEDQGVLRNLKLQAPVNFTPGRLVIAWALGFGKNQTRKLFFHGWTIREAYLTARRELKKMNPADLEWFGLKTPKKRSNSYASAREKRK